MLTNRRQFLRITSGLGIFSLMPRPVFSLARQLDSEKDPILGVSSFMTQSLDFNGDDTEKPHEGLWNPEGVAERAGGWPQPSESHSLVVVGGGISGLLSAYFLKEQKPIVLELAKQFGGNSKGEKMKQTTYSIGAAYLTVPKEGSNIDQLFKKLGLNQKFRQEKDEEVKFFQQKKLTSQFWSGISDPERADEFRRVAQELQRLHDESYPDIPWTSDSALSESDFKALDSVSFETWLQNKFGQIHPHILEYFELYAWSSFTAGISEISAAQMLNFVLAENEGVVAFPGGNAAIAQALFDDLKKNLGQDSLRSECLVIKVKTTAEGVLIYYLDPNNKLKSILAKKVIMACQKFVAKRVCVDMPSDQVQAIESMSYRAYLVGNAIYKKTVPSQGFDLYCYEGERPEEPRAMTPMKRNFTDFVMANWANHDSADGTILTIYRPLPFDGARQFLFNPAAHDKHLSLIKDGLKFFEKELGLVSSDLQGVRMTRWGHALPVAQVGFFSSGLAEIVNKNIQGKIFFANQDNYSNPSFEACFSAVEEVKATKAFS